MRIIKIASFNTYFRKWKKNKNICINFAIGTAPALARLGFSGLNFIFKSVFLKTNCVIQVA